MVFCVDLPGLTWTLSVTTAASSLARCVSSLIRNPPHIAYTVGCTGCGYVEGGNPAVWVSPLFSPVRLSLSAPCNYRPACREGLTTWFGRRSCSAVSLSLSLFHCLLSLQQPPKPFRPPAPIIQRLPPDGPIW